MFCFSGIFLLFSAPILDYVGVDPKISLFTQSFMRVSLIANFFNYQKFILKMVFVSIRRPVLATFFLPPLLIFHIFQCWLYLNVFEWGYLSMAYANLVTHFLSFLISYIIFRRADQCQHFSIDFSFMGFADCWKDFKSFKFETIFKVSTNYPQFLALMISSTFSALAAGATSVANVAIFVNIFLYSGAN